MITVGAFRGYNLRSARLFAQMTLDEVAEQVGKTRQYIHKLEVDEKARPSESMLSLLSDALAVEPEFFQESAMIPISEERLHFRKLFTTRAAIKQIAISKAEMFARFVGHLDATVELPAVRLPVVSAAGSVEDIELLANRLRSELDLGQGPIANMTRLVETRGAVVTTFCGVSEHVDALSIDSHRPIIVRNEAKKSPFRQRFDVAHELGHFLFHQGVMTGDRHTETEANRFASSLLLPRAMMAKYFPRPRARRLDWRALSEFKMTWMASKAALLSRARQLDLLTEDQYRTGVIYLKRNGEAREEREDLTVDLEQPEVVKDAMDVLYAEGDTFSAVAKKLMVKPSILTALGIKPSTHELNCERSSAEIIPLFRSSAL